MRRTGRQSCAVLPQCAFMHEVLYRWQFHFCVGDGGYYSFWRATLEG